MSKHLASCGHYVQDGITALVDDGSNGQGVYFSRYGTYCADCILEYYHLGRLLNYDLANLINRVATEGIVKRVEDAEKNFDKLPHIKLK